MENIALQIAIAANEMLNVIIILVLAYFSLICIGMIIREVSDARKRRAEDRNRHVR